MTCRDFATDEKRANKLTSPHEANVEVLSADVTSTDRSCRAVEGNAGVTEDSVVKRRKS